MLSYIRREKMSDYIVVKCGGSMLNQLNDVFFDCIKKLQQKYNVVIVHGGGPEIDAKLMIGKNTLFYLNRWITRNTKRSYGYCSNGAMRKYE